MSAELPHSKDESPIGIVFDALMARAGVTIPPDRRQVLIVGYEDLKKRSALLRQPRTDADSPAFIYRVTLGATP